MKQVSEMNPVEQQMMSALRCGEEESAVECAKVAEDVAIAFCKWFCTDVVSLKVLELPKGIIDTQESLYRYWVDNVYKKQ